jgi:hypothetical protein
LNCLHHWFFQLLLFLLINNTFCFPWFLILEHLFFTYFTSCGNIKIHHIHICSDCLCFSNKLNLCYCHKFPMKHLLHFSKLWIIYHLCPFKPQMWHVYEDVFYGFWLGCVASIVATMVWSFFFLHVSTLWFVIPQFVQCLSVFPILFYVFTSVVYLCWEFKFN